MPFSKYGCPSLDVFEEAISTDAPPSSFHVKNDHPVPRKGITSNGPIGTNKFYGNFYLGDQTSPVYTYPYAVSWVGGKGPTSSYGLAVSHIENSQRVLGGHRPDGSVTWYINPVGIHSMILGAKELEANTVLSLDSLTAFSAQVRLRKTSGAIPAVSFPVVQGMGFVTGLYTGSTPVIQSAVFFRTVTKIANKPKEGVAKYKFTLEDGRMWVLYAYPTKGDQLELQVLNNGRAEAAKPFWGSIQVTKHPGDGESILDEASGIYATDTRVRGTVHGAHGLYMLEFTRAGHAKGDLLMYALPHHVQSFSDCTRAAMTKLQLLTPTKGTATGMLCSRWAMEETNLPAHMGFSPYDPTKGNVQVLSDVAKKAIGVIAKSEVSQNMRQQAVLDSMYFSGKALAKFALIIYVINDMVGDEQLAQYGLQRLKDVFAVFAKNRQPFPLYYERAWGGIVSSASYITGSDGVDFGNTYYNDHHFHYSYFVLTAAVIGYLDSKWLADNKGYVNALVRDYANPSRDDKYFPQHRSFDWYHGHSWAHGLYPSLDGKNQESSSEDVLSVYAVMMWGQVIGDANMAARSKLQLAVQARSLQNYYLLTSDNQNHPAPFVPNKVAGILFENKCDHTTFFGSNIEYIEGIHMLPLLAASAYVRTERFVREEWDRYFSNGRIDEINSAWKGIIYGSLATVDPQAAWKYFANEAVSGAYIDGGASLTWYLAYSGAMMNVQESEGEGGWTRLLKRDRD